MMSKQERLRADIWASLRPVIEGEMSRTGLTAQEVINMALCDYFGISPKGHRHLNSAPTLLDKPINQSSNDDDDYI